MLLRLDSGADLQKTFRSLKRFAHFLLPFGLFAACSGEEPAMPVKDTEWVPLETGRYSVYDVEESRYAPGRLPETSYYEMLVEVVDSFPVAGEEYTYVIHRRTRSDEGAAWAFLDTWSARSDGHQVIVSEGSVPFVRVKFPVTIGNRWDGNALNTLGEDTYAYRDVGAPLQVNGHSFMHTMTVEQEYNDDVIVFTDKRTEVFAPDVGLVFKEVIQLYYCTDDACLGQQKIDRGTQMEMVIKSYGKY